MKSELLILQIEDQGCDRNESQFLSFQKNPIIAAIRAGIIHATPYSASGRALIISRESVML